MSGAVVLPNARTLLTLLLRIRPASAACNAADAFARAGVASGKATNASVSALAERVASDGQGADQLQLVRERGRRQGALSRLVRALPTALLHVMCTSHPCPDVLKACEFKSL